MLIESKNICQKRQQSSGQPPTGAKSTKQSRESVSTDHKVRNLKSKRHLKGVSKRMGRFDDVSEDDNEEMGKEFKKHLITEEELQALCLITNNYLKSWNQIKNTTLLKTSILKDFEPDEIKYHIKKERQTLDRKNGAKQKDNKQMQIQILSKRPRPQYEQEMSDVEPNIQKPPNIKIYKPQQPPAYIDLAQALINDFHKQNIDVRNKVLDQLALLIINDGTVLAESIVYQTKLCYDQCLKLFQDSSYNEAVVFLKQTSPMTAIIIQLNITKVLPTLVDECRTLSLTFMPFLSKCANFDFIEEQHHKTCARIVQSLVQNTLDANTNVEQGLVLFSLKFAPEYLQPAIKLEQSTEILAKGLVSIGFAEDTAILMSQHSEKFLWPDVICYLKSQQCLDYQIIVKVLSKMIVKCNPKEKLPQLAKYFDQRAIFIKTLMEQEVIPYTIPQLVDLLDMIKILNTETILQLFKSQPCDWIKQATVFSGKELQKEDEMTLEAVQAFYHGKTKGFNQKQLVPLETLEQISKEVEQMCDSYQHSMYQCAVAAIILSSPGSFKLTDMPTGSGKTWVQALIAKYYLNQQNTVTIVEPNDNLTSQTLNLLNNLHVDLQVQSIQEFYDYNNQDTIVIINEHDTIIKENPFRVTEVGLSGLWSLENRTIFFFSATSGVDYARIIKAALQLPTILSFKSEYEIVHQCTSINQGEIKPCNDIDMVLTIMEKDIAQYYEMKPIIVFTDKVNTKRVEDILNANRFTQFLVGATEENLKTIRGWKSGILILCPKDAIGVNTKFAVDSIVLITYDVQSEGEYKQTVGRSSRSRGLCESIYYPITNSSAQQVMNKMKSGSIQKLKELSKVIKGVWTRRNSKSFQEALLVAQEAGDQITSLKHLKHYIGSTEYAQLIKDAKL